MRSIWGPISRRPTGELWHNLTVPQHTASRGPGRPPAAKAAETRERIIQAAREVFSELGYDAATFQAIAIRADLTRPAINHYFASKGVLWREVVEQTNSLVVSAGRARAQDETSLLDRLSVFFTAAMQTDSEDRSAAAFLVTSVLESQRHPELICGLNLALVQGALAGVGSARSVAVLDPGPDRCCVVLRPAAA